MSIHFIFCLKVNTFGSLFGIGYVGLFGIGHIGILVVGVIFVWVLTGTYSLEDSLGFVIILYWNESLGSIIWAV